MFFTELMGQGSNIPVLATLTFDDQAHSQQLGNSNKQLNSTMNNLDEFVNNFLSPDQQCQSIKNPSSSSKSSSLVFQGNFNFNGTHRRKTADEVWREIICGEDSIVNPQPLMAVDPTVVMAAAQQEDWFKFPIQSVLDLNSQVGIENPPVEFGHSQNQLESPMPINVPQFSSGSHMGFVNKCSFKEEVMEKTIERRQKRMMKNRESAARSRERKQVNKPTFFSFFFFFFHSSLFT